MSDGNWFFGAVVGFTTAFLIQAFAGHWKLWVDGRKGAIDDLVKSIDAAKDASIKYYDNPHEAGQAPARDLNYAHKLTTDLFGIVDKRFGPAPVSVHAAFRTFREKTTGAGYMEKSEADKERAAVIAMAAAGAVNSLRDWSYGELNFLATGVTWCRRVRRNWPKKKYSEDEMAKLTR